MTNVTSFWFQDRSPKKSVGSRIAIVPPSFPLFAHNSHLRMWPRATTSFTPTWVQVSMASQFELFHKHGADRKGLSQETHSTAPEEEEERTSRESRTQVSFLTFGEDSHCASLNHISSLMLGFGPSKHIERVSA